MKARLSIIALALLMAACGGSRRLALPERLQPKEMTSLSTVDEALQPEDSVAFYAIRNGNSLTGYLMEPKDDFVSELILGFILHEKGAQALRGITLEELRKAEQQMVDILNAIVDSAQEVHRCFTPPRFYDHGRQYLFYTDTLGHRCLFVTFYDYRGEDEYLRRPLSVCDGDDGFWRAKFDLTKQELKWFEVNGPTIYAVPGRSKEPRGLLRQSRSRYWIPVTYEDIDKEELPERAKTFCDQRLTKNLQRRSDGIYLYDIHNGPTAYFDKKGNFLALLAEYSKGINLDDYFAATMPHRKMMLEKIGGDMQRHGIKGETLLFSVQRIKDKWMIGATTTEICIATYYTFDDKGQLIGIDREL